MPDYPFFEPALLQPGDRVQVVKKDSANIGKIGTIEPKWGKPYKPCLYRVRFTSDIDGSPYWECFHERGDLKFIEKQQ